MVGRGDWQLVSPTISGWFLRRDWKDGMGGGGILVGGGPSLFWTWHEGGPEVCAGGIIWRCPLPAGKEE